jgi:predicted nucleotidyltransferase component of viral defense system
MKFSNPMPRPVRACSGRRRSVSAPHPQNAEKDFWVCWTLDALFNGRTGGAPLLFKGGTSLSKGFGLIRRFSEDVDVTVFRDDLGQDYSFEQLEKMSGKKRGKALDTIGRERTLACRSFGFAGGFPISAVSS